MSLAYGLVSQESILVSQAYILVTQEYILVSQAYIRVSQEYIYIYIYTCWTFWGQLLDICWTCLGMFWGPFETSWDRLGVFTVSKEHIKPTKSQNGPT